MCFLMRVKVIWVIMFIYVATPYFCHKNVIDRVRVDDH